MHQNIFVKRKRQLATSLCISVALSATGIAQSVVDASKKQKTPKDAAAKFKTESPIKHVIMLIGENRGLDHTFGVYKPKGKKDRRSPTSCPRASSIRTARRGRTTAWPSSSRSRRSRRIISARPTAPRSPYNTSTNLMPQPNTNGAPQAPQRPRARPSRSSRRRPTSSRQNASLLTTGATGLPTGVLDTRVPGAGTLPPGPFVAARAHPQRR